MKKQNNNDWTGNSVSIHKILSASSHSKEDREENDYYATEPKATELLLELENFNNNILEPACGGGHMSDVLIKYGFNVTSTDLIDRGYGEQQDFFKIKEFDGDIITNPPYKFAKEFVQHGLSIIPKGNKLAMFLKIQFLESKGRKFLFENYPPKVVYVSSNRLLCAKNGDFVKAKKDGSAVCYCWFVWENGFTGDPIIKWFN